MILLFFMLLSPVRERKGTTAPSTEELSFAFSYAVAVRAFPGLGYRSGHFPNGMGMLVQVCIVCGQGTVPVPWWEDQRPRAAPVDVPKLVLEQ